MKHVDQCGLEVIIISVPKFQSVGVPLHVGSVLSASSLTRAFSSSLLRTITAHNYLAYFKIFSNFVDFSPIFRIFCSFFVL